MLKILIAVLLNGMCLSVSAMAQDAQLPEFQFRGHTIGEDANSTFKYQHELPDSCFKYTLMGKIQNYDKCPYENQDKYCYPSKDIKRDCSDLKDDIGGIPTKWMKYKIYKDKVYSVWVAFDPRFFPQISEMLKGKYGEPAAASAEPFETIGGAKYDNITEAWNFKEGKMVVRMRSLKADMGEIEFINPTVDAEIQQAENTALQQKGKTAF